MKVLSASNVTEELAGVAVSPMVTLEMPEWLEVCISGPRLVQLLAFWIAAHTSMTPKPNLELKRNPAAFLFQPGLFSKGFTFDGRRRNDG